MLTVLSFGLTTVSGLFVHPVNKPFEDLTDKYMIIYLDEEFIKSKIQSEHLEHKREVLELLRKKKLYGKLKKCMFRVQEVEYLGFKLRNNKLLVDPSWVQAA